MERLSRFAIYLGIGIGVTFFTLFLVAALPSILENSVDQWERLDKSNNSEEELRAKFVEHPSYMAMYERFPDAKEEISYHGRGNGNMKVGIMNFENNNQLILDLYYNDYEDKVNANAYCNTNSDRNRMNADGLFAEDFIRNTDCLEVKDDNDDEQVETQGTVTMLPRTEDMVRID